MHLEYKEQNCFIHLLMMQHTNRGLITAVDLPDCYEAMVVSRHLLVSTLLRK